MHGNAKNIQDQMFGYLKVLKRSDQKSDQGVLWECQCLLCGRTVTLPTKQLTSGHRISCGNHPELAHDRSKKELEKTRKDGVLMASFEKPILKNNTTGIRGVSPYSLRSGGIRYEAKLVVNGEQYRKKGFKTIEEAHEYRLELERKYLPPEFRQ